MSGPVTAMTQFMFENPDKLRGGNLEQAIAQRWPSVTVEQVRQALETCQALFGYRIAETRAEIEAFKAGDYSSLTADEIAALSSEAPDGR